MPSTPTQAHFIGQVPDRQQDGVERLACRLRSWPTTTTAATTATGNRPTIASTVDDVSDNQAALSSVRIGVVACVLRCAHLWHVGRVRGGHSFDCARACPLPLLPLPLLRRLTTHGMALTAPDRKVASQVEMHLHLFHQLFSIETFAALRKAFSSGDFTGVGLPWPPAHTTTKEAADGMQCLLGPALFSSLQAGKQRC